MSRCKLCLIPPNRPDTHFKDGICSACSSHAKRPFVDWEFREAELLNLLDRHHGRCIVPSSGGKDSTWQVLELLELGADVTVVTATTCYLTTVGKANIANLAKYARTIEITPNRIVRAKLNRLGLDLVGDISWPEHVSIFTTPFKVALDLGISLMFYGENPQNQYGGPPGSDEARTMTRRWVSEYGGFLGLRPQDMVGQLGITEKDMRDYMPPTAKEIEQAGIEAHFLGQYVPWDSERNATVSRAAGMVWHRPSLANWWPYENMDNGMTGVHDWFGYLKYGYGRLCAQISVDIRNGKISREDALEIVRQRDGLFPTEYMGVPLGDVLRLIGMTSSEFLAIADRFTNPDLFGKTEEGRPILKEFCAG